MNEIFSFLAPTDFKSAQELIPERLIQFYDQLLTNNLDFEGK